MQRLFRTRRLPAVLFALVAGLLLVGTTLAAEFAEGEIYRLPAGEVVADDLYVTASEIYIAGTVEGDLLAAAGYIEVSGTVTGDALLAAAEINISGAVQDDARLAAAGIDISGSIGDDLLMAAGGGQGAVPVPMGGRTVQQQGITMAGSTQVGGDLLIGAGEATAAGTITGDLLVGAGSLTLAAQVGGDARLGVDQLNVLETAQIDGILRYTSDDRANIPEGTAANVEFTEAVEDRTQPNPVMQFLGWFLRTVLILAGFALLGWLLLRFAPGILARPANALAAQPGRAALSGLLIALLFMVIPLLSALLIFLMVLFWGWFQGILLFFFLFSILALIWNLSPLVTGFWLGWRILQAMDREMSGVVTLLIGVGVLVLLGRIPVFGLFVYLLSFILALGGLFLARASQESAPSRVA
jgi:cytoskeletal protein CcmA (bactofilin family)